MNFSMNTNKKELSFDINTNINENDLVRDKSSILNDIIKQFRDKRLSGKKNIRSNIKKK